MTAGWNVEIAWHPELTVVTPVGEINQANVESLRAAMQAALAARDQDQPGGTVCCDLSQVSFMDSSGLGALIAAHRRAARDDVHLCLAGAHGAVFRLLQLTQIDRAISVYESVSTARTATARHAHGGG